VIRFLHLGEVLELHRRLIITSGGSPGLRDLGLLEAALSQPRQTFAGEDLYPTIIAKAACLDFSLITNHPFVDGNKRIGHAATEVMLMLNGYELRASVEAAEGTILAVASGGLERGAYTSWVERHSHPLA
jgi:death-on-curing protein